MERFLFSVRKQWKVLEAEASKLNSEVNSPLGVSDGL